jgi:hypothetical protein
MNKLTSSFALSFTIFAVGCVGDNTVPATQFPQSCAEIEGAKDGEYVLYIDHDETRPWGAYCADLDSKSPKTFLTLPQGGDLNVSYYEAGGRSPGDTVETRFDKVRIDPLTLQVDIGDLTFAVTKGKVMHLGTQEVTAMPFGTVMSCGAGFRGGQIDLMGTPFITDEALWAIGGEITTRRGNADEWENKQVVELWADGDCGWTTPLGTSPIDSTGTLQLKYVK